MKKNPMKTSKNLTSATTKTKIVIPITVNKPFKRSLSPDIIAKGQEALKQWRIEKAYAEKKGGKFLAAWIEEQAEKKRAKQGRSPTTAIREFCLQCVGGSTADVRGCTAPKCALFTYRPYQKGDAQ